MTDLEQEVKLEYSWEFWFDEVAAKGASKTDFEGGLRSLGKFGTIQEFWRFWNLKIFDKLPSHCNLYLFKEGIRPLWEDPANERGGRWQIRAPKSKEKDMRAVWADIVLAVIGEQLSAAHSCEMCGIVMQARHGEVSVSIWNKDASKRELISEMTTSLRDVLNLGRGLKIRYQAHQAKKNPPAMSKEGETGEKALAPSVTGPSAPMPIPKGPDMEDGSSAPGSPVARVKAMSRPQRSRSTDDFLATMETAAAVKRAQAAANVQADGTDGSATASGQSVSHSPSVSPPWTLKKKKKKKKNTDRAPGSPNYTSINSPPKEAPVSFAVHLAAANGKNAHSTKTGVPSLASKSLFTTSDSASKETAATSGKESLDLPGTGAEPAEGKLRPRGGSFGNSCSACVAAQIAGYEFCKGHKDLEDRVETRPVSPRRPTSPRSPREKRKDGLGRKLSIEKKKKEKKEEVLRPDGVVASQPSRTFLESQRLASEKAVVVGNTKPGGAGSAQAQKWAPKNMSWADEVSKETRGPLEPEPGLDTRRSKSGGSNIAWNKGASDNTGQKTPQRTRTLSQSSRARLREALPDDNAPATLHGGGRPKDQRVLDEARKAKERADVVRHSNREREEAAEREKAERAAKARKEQAERARKEREALARMHREKEEKERRALEEREREKRERREEEARKRRKAAEEEAKRKIEKEEMQRAAAEEKARRQQEEARMEKERAVREEREAARREMEAEVEARAQEEAKKAKEAERKERKKEKEKERRERERREREQELQEVKGAVRRAQAEREARERARAEKLKKADKVDIAPSFSVPKVVALTVAAAAVLATWGYALFLW